MLKDDAVEIAEKVKEADTLVFAAPIYYYEMSGQMKTPLDRLNPLFPSDYCAGINDMGEPAGKEDELKEAYDFGKALV